MPNVASSERTRNYLRQIKGTILFKIGAMGASFLAMPLMLQYLGAEQFGVWSTLLTIVSWIVFFDLGIGNGLRNKVAQAIATDDHIEAANYIASGYSLIGLFSLFLWLLSTGATFIVNWQLIFNTVAISESTLRLTVQISCFFIALNFWIGLIAAVLGALQKTSYIALGQFAANAMALLFVYILWVYFDSSLIYLACSYGASMVMANAILSFWFYRQHIELLPKLNLNKVHINPLISIGMRFFVIQLAVLVVFTTDKLLITQLFGPGRIAEYDVVFRIFSVITLLHALISTPLWSSYTDAYFKGDVNWIKQMIMKQLWVFIGVALLTFFLTFLTEEIALVWVGSSIVISKNLVISTALFVLVSTWNNIFAIFLNGIGEVKVQLYTAAVAMVLNVPLALYFVRVLGWDLGGVVSATVVSLLFSSVFLPIHAYKLISLKKDAHVK